MNVKELAKQAGFDFDDYYDSVTQEELERFAELVCADERAAYAKQFITDAERDENIRSEERKHCAADYLKIMRDAVAREREACAKLCESMGVYPELNVWNGGPDWYKRQKECAAAIRQRGDK